MVSLIKESIKRASKRNCNDNDYHIQDNYDVDHSTIKTSINTTKFSTFPLYGV